MKLKAVKKLSVIGTAALLGLSMTACGKEPPAQEPVMMEVEEPEYEEDFEDDYEDEYEDDHEEDEENEKDEDDEDFSVEEYYDDPEVEPEEESQISFEDVIKSYEDLVDVYNQVNSLYMSDEVPRDEGVEEILNSVSIAMDEIVALDEEDIPTDEDKLAVLIRIGELDSTLGELIEPMYEAADEKANYDQLLEIVQANYEYMDSYFNAVWDHFSQYGGSDAQIQAVVLARDEIGNLDDIPTDTTDDLYLLDNRIDNVINILDAICESTR